MFSSNFVTTLFTLKRLETQMNFIDMSLKWVFGRKNFWGFSRKIPASFYSGTTGIEPIDDAIKKVLNTGYAHHIERLMILGNFMVLCEFDPDEDMEEALVIDEEDEEREEGSWELGRWGEGTWIQMLLYLWSTNNMNI